MKAIVVIIHCEEHALLGLYEKSFPDQLIQETTCHRYADGVRCYKYTSSSAKRRSREIVQGCLKEEDITCNVKKQEYEKMKGKGEMSETKEEENKIVISTKNTNIVIHYRSLWENNREYKLWFL